MGGCRGQCYVKGSFIQIPLPGRNLLVRFLAGWDESSRPPLESQREEFALFLYSISGFLIRRGDLVSPELFWL